MKYTIDEKIACLSREVQMRRRVYAHQVNEGRMAAATAEKEIGIMTEVMEEYQTLQDHLNPSLFDA